jgi:hypothetical protein
MEYIFLFLAYTISYLSVHSRVQPEPETGMEVDIMYEPDIMYAILVNKLGLSCAKLRRS